MFHRISMFSYKCPANTNPAEFLIDLVSYNSSNSESMAASRRRIAHLADTFSSYQSSLEYVKSQNRVEKTVSLEMSSFSTVQSSLSASAVTSQWPKSDSKKPTGSLHPSKSNTKKGLFSIGLFRPLGSLVQATVKAGARFSLLLSRAYKQMARDMQTNVVRLVVSGVLAVIVGSVYGKATGNRDITLSSASARINILAQAVVNVGMMSVVKTLQILKREKVIVDRERQSSQYSAMEYLLAKSMVELPVDAIFASVRDHFTPTFFE